MPKVYKNRKKHIDPRYFLDETVNRGEEEPLNEPNSTDGVARDEPSTLLQESQGESTADTFDVALEALRDVVDDARMYAGAHSPGEERGIYRHKSIHTKGGSDADVRDAERRESIYEDILESLLPVLEMFEKYHQVALDDPDKRSPEEEDKIRSSVLGSMAKNPPSTPWSKGR